MTRLIRLAARLYPSWWRRRYAREFDALLDDAEPGWRALLDVLKGAFAMQMKTLMTVPAVCVLAGAILGGVISLWTPTIYAATTTLRLGTRTDAALGPSTERELHTTLETALAGYKGAQAATRVELLAGGGGTATIRVTYNNRDAAEAKRMVQDLSAAVTNASVARGLSADILTVPASASPIQSNHAAAIAWGGLAGLVGGGIAMLVRRMRRGSTNLPLS